MCPDRTRPRLPNWWITACALVISLLWTVDAWARAGGGGGFSGGGGGGFSGGGGGGFSSGGSYGGGGGGGGDVDPVVFFIAVGIYLVITLVSAYIKSQQKPQQSRPPFRTSRSDHQKNVARLKHTDPEFDFDTFRELPKREQNERYGKLLLDRMEQVDAPLALGEIDAEGGIGIQMHDRAVPQSHALLMPLGGLEVGAADARQRAAQRDIDRQAGRQRQGRDGAAAAVAVGRASVPAAGVKRAQAMPEPACRSSAPVQGQASGRVLAAG